MQNTHLGCISLSVSRMQVVLMTLTLVQLSREAVCTLHSLHWGSCGEHPAPIKNEDGVASTCTVHWLCSVHWFYTVHWLCSPASHDLHLRSNKCDALSLVLRKAD